MKIKGKCIMGCGETLFLGEGGYVTCSWSKCPNPSANSEIMEEGETRHIVVITDTSFNIKHPLRERIADALFECKLHEHLSQFSGPPLAPGTYKASHHGNRWHWQTV